MCTAANFLESRKVVWNAMQNLILVSKATDELQHVGWATRKQIRICKNSIELVNQRSLKCVIVGVMLYWEINKYMLNVNMNSAWKCLLIITAVCRVYLGLPCPPSLLRIPSVLWSIWLLLGHKIAFLASGVEPVRDCQVVLRAGSITSGSVAIQNVGYKREWSMFGHSVWQSLCYLDQNR